MTPSLVRRLVLRMTTGLFVGILATSISFAARTGRIDVDGVDVFNGPGEGYEVIDQLPHDAPVTASNYPTEGYYKIRTSTGRVGWVEADSIKFDNPLSPGSSDYGTSGPAGPGQEQAPLAADPSNPFRGGSPAYKRESSASKRVYSFVRVRALGGGTFFKPADVNDQLSFSEMNGGFSYGGELGFRFTKDFAVMFRAENLSRNLAAHNPTANKSYNIEYYTFPVMAGVEVTLSEERSFSTSFAVFAGLGVNSTLSSAELSTPSQITSYQNTSFAGLGKLNISYHFNKDAHVTAEVGYRFLRTPQLDPGQTDTGGEIWQVNSAFRQLSLDFSGVLLGAGITLQF
ncbi:MAG: outer membrane beta-barrel protein [Bdellovibrionales bacterium]|nr:outer membrane beta-barrel protein [Bdellovibrionales bacterium]